MGDPDSEKPLEWNHRLRPARPEEYESRDPHSIRYSPTEWAALKEAAEERGMDVSTLTRDLSLFGLKVLLVAEDQQAKARSPIFGLRITK